ncbi:unnamed protein product, partial [Closterium sp. NIES-53]
MGDAAIDAFTGAQPVSKVLRYYPEHELVAISNARDARDESPPPLPPDHLLVPGRSYLLLPKIKPKPTGGVGTAGLRFPKSASVAVGETARDARAGGEGGGSYSSMQRALRKAGSQAMEQSDVDPALCSPTESTPQDPPAARAFKPAALLSGRPPTPPTHRSSYSFSCSPSQPHTSTSPPSHLSSSSSPPPPHHVTATAGKGLRAAEAAGGSGENPGARMQPWDQGSGGGGHGPWSELAAIDSDRSDSSQSERQKQSEMQSGPWGQISSAGQTDVFVKLQQQQSQNQGQNENENQDQDQQQQQQQQQPHPHRVLVPVIFRSRRGSALRFPRSASASEAMPASTSDSATDSASPSALSPFLSPAHPSPHATSSPSHGSPSPIKAKSSSKITSKPFSKPDSAKPSAQPSAKASAGSPRERARASSSLHRKLSRTASGGGGADGGDGGGSAGGVGGTTGGGGTGTGGSGEGSAVRRREKSTAAGASSSSSSSSLPPVPSPASSPLSRSLHSNTTLSRTNRPSSREGRSTSDPSNLLSASEAAAAAASGSAAAGATATSPYSTSSSTHRPNSRPSSREGRSTSDPNNLLSAAEAAAAAAACSISSSSTASSSGAFCGTGSSTSTIGTTSTVSSTSSGSSSGGRARRGVHASSVSYGGAVLDGTAGDGCSPDLCFANSTGGYRDSSGSDRTNSGGNRNSGGGSADSVKVAHKAEKAKNADKASKPDRPRSAAGKPGDPDKSIKSKESKESSESTRGDKSRALHRTASQGREIDRASLGPEAKLGGRSNTEGREGMGERVKGRMRERRGSVSDVDGLGGFGVEARLGGRSQTEGRDEMFERAKERRREREKGGVQGVGSPRHPKQKHRPPISSGLAHEHDPPHEHHHQDNQTQQQQQAGHQQAEGNNDDQEREEGQDAPPINAPPSDAPCEDWSRSISLAHTLNNPHGSPTTLIPVPTTTPWSGVSRVDSLRSQEEEPGVSAAADVTLALWCLRESLSMQRQQEEEEKLARGSKGEGAGGEGGRAVGGSAGGVSDAGVQGKGGEVDRNRSPLRRFLGALSLDISAAHVPVVAAAPAAFGGLYASGFPAASALPTSIVSKAEGRKQATPRESEEQVKHKNQHPQQQQQKPQQERQQAEQHQEGGGRSRSPMRRLLRALSIEASTEAAAVVAALQSSSAAAVPLASAPSAARASHRYPRSQSLTTKLTSSISISSSSSIGGDSSGSAAAANRSGGGGDGGSGNSGSGNSSSKARSGGGGGGSSSSSHGHSRSSSAILSLGSSSSGSSKHKSSKEENDAELKAALEAFRKRVEMLSDTCHLTYAANVGAQGSGGGGGGKKGGTWKPRLPDVKEVEQPNKSLAGSLSFHADRRRALSDQLSLWINAASAAASAPMFASTSGDGAASRNVRPVSAVHRQQSHLPRVQTSRTQGRHVVELRGPIGQLAAARFIPSSLHSGSTRRVHCNASAGNADGTGSSDDKGEGEGGEETGKERGRFEDDENTDKRSDDAVSGERKDKVEDITSGDVFSEDESADIVSSLGDWREFRARLIRGEVGVAGEEPGASGATDGGDALTGSTSTAGDLPSLEDVAAGSNAAAAESAAESAAGAGAAGAAGAASGGEAGGDAEAEERRSNITSPLPSSSSPSSTSPSSSPSTPSSSSPKSWAHPIAVPETGCVLLAHPRAFGVSQQYFNRAVIFLLMHGPQGTAGVILN